jgi:hypothetical protein
MARRDEYDRRMEYDLSAFCQIRKMSTAEDFELQVRRLDEMGKIIDTLTTMLTKPPQPQGSATEKITLLRSCSQTQAYEECEDWSLQMTDKERGVLNELVLMLEPSESIETTGEFSSQQVLALEAGVVGSGYILRASNDELMEPGEFSSQEVLARKVRRIPRPDMDPRREVKAGFGFDRASEEELKERPTVKICRRGTAFPYGKDPGFPRAQEDELKARNILKTCRKTDAEGLVGTPHVAVVLAHAHREATRGAEGRQAGLQRKENAIQKRRLSRIKRAGEYWGKGSSKQETSDTSNKKQRKNKQVLEDFSKSNKEIRSQNTYKNQI